MSADLENPSPAPKQQVYTLPRLCWAVPFPHLARGAALRRCHPPPHPGPRDQAWESVWGGGSRTSLTVCASETEHKRASHSPPRAAARPPVPGAPARASRMNEAPLPHKGIPRGPQVPGRRGSAQPTPSGASDKEMLGRNCRASLNLPFLLPKTKAHPGLSRPPRARPLRGAAAPEVLFGVQGARPTWGWGEHTGTCPS